MKRTRTVDTKFYTYYQNNSGGRFVEDEKLSHFVIIEAASAKEANSIADDIGIYFNGCDSGLDCECCGDRWSRGWRDESTDTPKVYDTPAEDYVCSFMREPVTIHYYDGKIVKCGKTSLKDKEAP